MLRGPGRRLDGVVGRRSTPQSAARPCSRKRADGRLQVLAADVVEEDVDAVGRRRRELLGHRAVVVVERGGEAELPVSQAHLLRASRRCRRRADAPRSRANWPTRLPTAPAAPDTKTSSPGWNAATRNSPAQAVSPGMPRTPRW